MGPDGSSAPRYPFSGIPPHMLRLLSAVPKFTVTALIVVAIVNLLVGVILRYFVGAITDWLDVDPVPFTWVEEVGELSLAWLTLIGAAIGIQSVTLQNFREGYRRLPDDVLQAMARQLNTSANFLMDRSDDPRPAEPMG